MSSQQEISKALGISQITVSRALNDDPRVRPALRKRILKQAEKTGYVKNRIASSFKRGNTRLIGFLIPRINCSFFPDMANVLDGLAREAGYHIILAYTDESPEKTKSEIRLLMEHRVEGLIITPPAGDTGTDIWSMLTKRDIPFVLIDRYLPGCRCSYVVTDNVRGGRLATEHLLELGHTRIGHLRGRRHTSSSDEVYAGFRQALRGAEVKSNPLWVAGDGFDEQDGYEAAARLMALKPRPTALVAVNDTVAVGALRLCEERRIRVPADVAVVGYSDIQFAGLLKVPLTTVREDVDAIARTAFDTLHRTMTTGDRSIRQIRVPPELIVRASSGAKRRRTSAS